MITSVTVHKNQSDHILAMLKSLQYPVFQRVIVLDTGSSPEELNKLRSLRDYFKFDLYEFKHDDPDPDMSLLRNEAMKYLREGEIFLSIDCDERIVVKNQNYLNYIVGQHNAIPSRQITAWVVDIKHWHTNLFQEEPIFRCENVLRVGVNLKGIRWEGRIHESIKDSASSLGSIGRLPPQAIYIAHNGYDISVKEMGEKLKRNSRSLLKEINNNPDNIHAWYHLGKVFRVLGKPEEVVKCFKKAISIKGGDEKLKHMLKQEVFKIVVSLNQGGNYA